jgi:nucleotide-binding universal stress UspA family protein
MHTQALLPLVTYPDPNSDAVAENAVAMAAILDASLHALAINADLPMVGNAVSRVLLDVPEMVRQTEAMSRERGRHLLAEVEKAAAARGVEATTNAITPKLSLLTEAAARHGRYYDYVLCGWEARNATSASTAEAVVFGCGRPTVLLPELSPVGAIDHVAIAWDGSRVAARAVGDAGKLLRRASRVSVLTVLGEKPLGDADAAERLAAGLRKRGIDAAATPVSYRGDGIAALLQEQAIERGAGLLVMGAFGHSRARDFILGGATQGILADLRLPILMSH